MITDTTKNTDSAFNMRCEQCKVNSERDQEGVHNKATICYSKLPEVLLVSVNRFDSAGSGRKLSNNIHPSSICNLEENGQETSYYLKSVIQHHGQTINAGHYTTALNMDGTWLIVNDSKFEVQLAQPMDGYIFLYEKSPLNLPQPNPQTAWENSTLSTSYKQAATKRGRAPLSSPNVDPIVPLEAVKKFCNGDLCALHSVYTVEKRNHPNSTAAYSCLSVQSQQLNNSPERSRTPF